MPRTKGSPRRLSLTDKEVIYQTYLATGNKAETSRRIGRPYATVVKVLKEMEDMDAIVPGSKEARAEAAAKLQSRLRVKVDDVLESISKEDIQSGRIPVRDSEGKIVKYQYFGPSLLQKATAVGILTDKMRVARDYERTLLEEEHLGNLMMPKDVAGLIDAIQSKIKSLSILNVRFSEENPELVEQTQEILGDVERIERAASADAEVCSIDEFDN